MNRLLYILLILSLSVTSFNNIQAQTLESDSSSLNGSEFKFPPLEVVIDSVLKRSAMINFRNKHIGVKESTLASERIYWTKNLGLQAETRYGTFDNFSTVSGDNTTVNLASNTQQLNYNVGLYLKIPIFDVINRKNQIKLAKLEVDEAKSMAEFQKEEISQTVIIMYQDLILKQKLLQIRSRRLGDGKVNMQMVEKEFRNGVVPLPEYVRIVGMTENMEADYAKAMSEFITSKLLLEDMSGFVFGLTRIN